MIDCKGNELHIGDDVVFIRGKNSDASLATGKITKIYENRYHKEECSVGSQSHIYNFRVMKLREEQQTLSEDNSLEDRDF